LETCGRSGDLRSIGRAGSGDPRPTRNARQDGVGRPAPNKKCSARWRSFGCPAIRAQQEIFARRTAAQAGNDRWGKSRFVVVPDSRGRLSLFSMLIGPSFPGNRHNRTIFIPIDRWSDYSAVTAEHVSLSWFASEKIVPIMQPSSLSARHIRR
jgi:hypothetical protein